MWGDLIFPISPFIMQKFADNLTITFLHFSSFAKEHKNVLSSPKSPNFNTVAVPLEFGIPSWFLA